LRRLESFPTQLLLETVEAYRDALKELTRERVPLQWHDTKQPR
jgi:hypothetical protein